MTPSLRTFWLPRRGCTPDEYDDAFAADEPAGRYAVADGATDSCFAGLWARMLVQDFVRRADADLKQWPAGLPAVQKQWEADVGSRRLDWYVEAKLAERGGGHATFLGLVLTPSGDAAWRWQAAAVGDACLFHTRGDTLQIAFPLERSGQFTNVPALLCSRGSLKELIARNAAWREGALSAGDRLWLATDALAQWCLSEQDSGGNPWTQMESVLAGPEPRTAFAAWIGGLRDRNRMRNDDVTLLQLG